MTYINNVQSLDDLKSQYRALALKNHPDAGGSDEAMKAINAEYDALFPIWKHRDNVTSNETAASTRRAFYTEYGWQGERYDSNLTLKEIAVKVREFIKIYFNDFKFSVRTAYASMCQELRVAITEVPCEPYKTRDQWTQEESDIFTRKELQLIHDYNYSADEIEKEAATMFYTPRVSEAIKSVNDYVNSFNFDDSDAQIDYFNINFYFFGTQLDKNNNYYKIVPRAYKAPKSESVSTQTRPENQDDNTTQTAAEAAEAYTVTEDTDTRDNSALWVVKFVDKLSRNEYLATPWTLWKYVRTSAKSLNLKATPPRRGILWNTTRQKNMTRL